MTICNYDFTGISSNIANKSIADLEKKIAFDKYFSHFADDYKLVSTIRSKRMQQILYIRTFRTNWKLFKGIIIFLALFAKKIK